LEDLQYLDSDSLRQAIQDNPHLAQQIERLQQEEAFANGDQMSSSSSSRGGGSSSSSSSSSSSRSNRTMKKMDRPYRRRPDGTVYQEEDSYLEEMRKDGIPIVKWITVLVLLIALVYQIYQTLKGPDGGKDKKTKNKKKRTSSSSTTMRTNNVKLDAEKIERLAAEVGPSVQKGNPSSTTTTTSSTKKKSQKKKVVSNNKAKSSTSTALSSVNPNTSTPTIKKRVQPLDRTLPAAMGNDDATDQGSWHVVGKTAEKKKEASPTAKEATSATATVPENGTWTEDVPNSSGATQKEGAILSKEMKFQTSKKSKAKKSNTKTEPSSPELVPEDKSETAAKEEARKMSSSGPLEVPVSESPLHQPESSKQKKNGHQNKKTSPPVSMEATSDTKEATATTTTTTNTKPAKSGTDTPTTLSEDGDAALAKQLQQEEDKLAGSSSSPSSSLSMEQKPKNGTTTEHAWEEVVTKKRRAKS
jgi:hypothetical protein